MTFVASKKYGAALKKACLADPPAAVVYVVRPSDASTSGRAPGPAPAPPAPPPAFRVAAPNGVTFSTPSAMATDEGAMGGEAQADDDDDDGWATASEEEEEEAWVAWDPCVSLFDNARFRTVEACLEHMWRAYGFYLPDAAYLADPAGLVAYLGEKLANGRVPLYARGDDGDAKQFPSLHAVQRHMVDSGRTKLAWEGNEAEYDEWYDYSAALEGEEDEDEGGGLGMVVDGGGDHALPAASATGLAAYELALPGTGKLLGSRHLARFYRQKHRPGTEARAGATAAALAAKYKLLGVGGLEDGPGAAVARARAHKARTRVVRAAMRAELNANVTRNLPRNVPY